MFLVNTRKRNKDETFEHERMPKGRYAVYEFKKASEGKEAKEKALEEIPTDKDPLLLIHGFNNDFENVTDVYLVLRTKFARLGFRGTSSVSLGRVLVSGTCITGTRSRWSTQLRRWSSSCKNFSRVLDKNPFTLAPTA